MLTTSTVFLICLSRSLCFTPKRCSSSTITKPRSRNCDVLRQQAVGADGDIDLALGQIRQRRLDFLGRTEAAEHLHAHRKRLEAALEGLEMLKC